MAQRNRRRRTRDDPDEALWRVGDPAPTLVPMPVTAPAVPRFLSAPAGDRELGIDDIWLPPLDPSTAVTVMGSAGSAGAGRPAGAMGAAGSVGSPSPSVSIPAQLKISTPW